MRKVLFVIVVLLVILQPKTTLVQDGNTFHLSKLKQQAYSPAQTISQQEGFDLDDDVLDFADDNLNDSEKKNFSIQHIAFSTGYLVTHPDHDHLCKSKWIPQNDLAFQSPLFLLHRAFRI
jgi:hypothetical protein